MGNVLSAALFAQALASTPTVPATQPPTQAAPSVVVTHEWYRYKTLPIDAVSLTLIGMSVSKEFGSLRSLSASATAAFVATGISLYALGPPSSMWLTAALSSDWPIWAFERLPVS